MEGCAAPIGGPVTTTPPCCCRGAVRSELQNRQRIAVCRICSPQYGQAFVVGATVVPAPVATGLEAAAPQLLQKLAPSATVCPQLEHVMMYPSSVKAKAAASDAWGVAQIAELPMGFTSEAVL